MSNLDNQNIKNWFILYEINGYNYVSHIKEIHMFFENINKYETLDKICDSVQNIRTKYEIIKKRI